MPDVADDAAGIVSVERDKKYFSGYHRERYARMRVRGAADGDADRAGAGAGTRLHRDLGVGPLLVRRHRGAVDRHRRSAARRAETVSDEREICAVIALAAGIRAGDDVGI